MTGSDASREYAAFVAREHRELMDMYGALTDAGDVTCDADGIRQLTAQRDRLRVLPIEDCMDPWVCCVHDPSSLI